MQEGVVAFISSRYGLLLSKDNILRDNLLLVFGPWSQLGDIKVSDLGQVDEIFQVGMNVLFKTPPVSPCANIIRITHMLPEDSLLETSLTPMVTVSTGVKKSHIAVGMTNTGQLACIHPHLLVSSQLGRVLVSNADVTTSDVDESQIGEFHTVVVPGRTLEGRLGLAPKWVNEAFQQEGINVKYLAVSAENLSTTFTGIAKFVKAAKASILIRSIDEPAQEIIFPLALIPRERHQDYLNIPKEKMLFYYTACKNIPGSKYPLRAYNLSVVEGGQHIIEQLNRSTAEDRPQVPATAESDVTPADTVNELDLIQF